MNFPQPIGGVPLNFFATVGRLATLAESALLKEETS